MNTIMLMVYFVLVAIILVLAYLFFNVKKHFKELVKKNNTDIIATNKLLLKKSENELNLFFEFEAAVSESIRLSRKSQTVSREILEHQKEIVKILKHNSKKS